MMELIRNGLQWGVLAMGMCILSFLTSSAGTFVGINFRSHVSSSVVPNHVVELVKNLGVEHVRLHDANSSILRAFAYSDVDILVGITNDLIPAFASSQAFAYGWVNKNLLAYLPIVKITGLVVGDEVLTEFSWAAGTLLPAMQNIHNALVAAKLDKQIKVSTSHSSSILSSGFFPSQAHFKASFSAWVQPILDFLSATESFFMLSFNPIDLYLQSSHNSSLDYALFVSNKGVLDANANLVYQNLFDAVVDAAFNAMGAMNHPELPIVVSETGWPWAGTAAEEASPENAAIFNTNLVRHILNNKGTPLRPDAEIHTYMFDPFSEAKKAGIISEYEWRMFVSNTQKPLNYRQLLGFSTRDSVNGSQSWCIAKNGIPDTQLATALNWACGPQGNADCGPIQNGGPCYNPNTYSSHASYAFNSYYQKNGQTAIACDFGGSAMVVPTDPSYAGCTFPPSGGSGSGGNQTFNPNGSNNPSSSLGLPLRATSSHLIAAVLSLPILAYLRL
ncbi:hypothetical protein O6H91_06G117300 [Diphasiastrum complanatum]|uniref:Uncharacterized protein n=1 Tax=Diphasiastrum complanatum TaxID=34168 RepID=A0ACC2DIA6_DIPCM|nr:hypothetical protein O6H91_06G117300 [Diphasiastrum complanatum]